MLSTELMRLYASAENPDVAGDWWLETLSFTHPEIPDQHVTNQPTGFSATLETAETVFFRPLAFAVLEPRRDDAGRMELTVNIDNVGAELMAVIEAAQLQATAPPALTRRIFLASNRDEPARVTPLSVLSASCTDAVVALRASRADVLNRRYPSLLYRGDLYPGLVR